MPRLTNNSSRSRKYKTKSLGSQKPKNSANKAKDLRPSTTCDNEIDISCKASLQEASLRNYNPTVKAYTNFCRYTYNDQANFEGINPKRALAFLNAKTNGTLKDSKKKKTSYKVSTIKSVINGLKFYRRVSRESKEYIKKTPCSENFDDAVKLFLSSYIKNQHKTSVAENTKKSGVEETYNEAQLENMIATALSTTKDKKNVLSTISMLVLSQSLMFRGDNVRQIEFTDLKFTPENCRLNNIAGDNKLTEQMYPDHGKLKNNIFLSSSSVFSERVHNRTMENYKNKSAKADMLVVVATKGKTNQTNKRFRVGFVRHCDVIFCAQFWLSVHLVNKFHVSALGENICFDDKDSFFQLKVFNDTNDKDLKNKTKYDQHHHRIQKIMKSANVHLNNTTHAARAAGAQICDQKGVILTDIQRAGGWQLHELSTSMLESYLYNIVLGPMAALAGAVYTPEGWKYNMPRYIVKPKDKLKMKLFPFINAILEEGSKRTFEKTEETKKMAYETALSLDHLRTVFLQDYKFFQEVCNKDVLKKHAVFNHKIFKTKEYEEFRLEQDKFYDNYYNELQNASNIVNNEIEPKYAKEFFEQLKEKIEDLQKQNVELKLDFEASVRSIIRTSVEERIDEVQKHLEKIYNGVNNVQNSLGILQNDMNFLKVGMNDIQKSLRKNFESYADKPKIRAFPNASNINAKEHSFINGSEHSSKITNSSLIDCSINNSESKMQENKPPKFNGIIVTTEKEFQYQPSKLFNLETDLSYMAHEVRNLTQTFSHLMVSVQENSKSNSRFEEKLSELSESHRQDKLEMKESHKQEKLEIIEKTKELLENYFSIFKQENEKMDHKLCAISNQFSQSTFQRENLISENPTNEENDIPDVSYVYSLKSKSFQEVWEEYKIPKQNVLSIEQLDEKYKTKWRITNSLRKKYSRRNRVYKAMKIGLSKGYSESECYELLENARIKHNLPLGQFMDHKDFFPLELQDSSSSEEIS